MASSLRRLLVVATTLVPLLLAPLAAAQSAAQTDKCTRECDPMSANGGTIKKGTDPVNVILYGHFQDILNLAPLNAQPPDDQREPDLNHGFQVPSVDTNSGQAPGGTQLDTHFKNNEFTMFSSPGLVEIPASGEWRTHQEPGLADDMTIAGDELHLYWYLSAHAVPGQSSSDGTGRTATVGALPQIGVYARLETGRFVGHGALIAESKDADANAPGAERVNVLTVPGQPDVYEFLVPMKVLEHTVPSSEKAAGFVLYVNPYQVKTKNPFEVQVMQEEWRLRTGPKFPPRLVVPVAEPMKTLASTLSLFENRLFVRWTLVSDLGSYDMRDSMLQLVNTGAGKIDPKAIEFIILKRSVDHDGHFKPVNATWAIDYTNFPLADGDYELTASIPNLQQSYLLEQKFAFKVVDGKPQVQEIGHGGGSGSGGAGKMAPVEKSPGPELGLSLAILGAVAVAAARRRRA